LIKSTGADVMIFKIFSPKNSAKKIGVFSQNKAKICTILMITLVYEKNANFFAKNCQKSQKIVIITSTPGQSGSGFFTKSDPKPKPDRPEKWVKPSGPKFFTVLM
jgi:Ni,Fe-hydrogenase III small subunit